MNTTSNATTDIEISYFIVHETGLVAVTLKTPLGDLRFTGCWDEDRWHRNDRPIWTFSKRNPNGSYDIWDIEKSDIPRPTKPTKRSFKAAVEAWFKRHPAAGPFAS